MNGLARYFINDKEFSEEKFKSEYEFLLSIWLSAENEKPEIIYENDDKFTRKITKIFHAEFKIVEEKVQEFIVNESYGKFVVPAGMPVRDDAGKIIGITNGDGSISITDPEFIKIITELKTKPLSVSYYKEVMK